MFLWDAPTDAPIAGLVLFDPDEVGDLLVGPNPPDDVAMSGHDDLDSGLLSPCQSQLLSEPRYRFAMDGIGERLKRARKARGYKTIIAAAEAFGWHKQNVSDQEAERRGVSPEQADKYAKAYGVDRTWLLYGGPTPKPKRAGTIPVIGRVGADPEGRVLFAEGQRGGEVIPLPVGHSERAAAVLVSGHSMPDVADDGALIIFEEQHTKPTRQHIGKVVVAELETGEVLVKRLLRGDEPGLWDLESLAGEPRSNVRLKWVASITMVIHPPKSRELINAARAAVA